MPIKIFITLGGVCPFGLGCDRDSLKCRQCRYYYRTGTGTFFWCNHPVEQNSAEIEQKTRKIARETPKIAQPKRKRGRPPGKTAKTKKKTTKKGRPVTKAILRPVQVIKQEIK